MSKQVDIDAYGKGLISYTNGNKKARFSVYSNIAATEKWEVGLFFRSFDTMSALEQTALQACRGRVLDAGAGAGSHSLWLQNKGLEVVAIDISEGAVEVMNRRGVAQARPIDFFHLTDERFDTILMLMNGIGIVETIERLPIFFHQCRLLLNEGGCVLVDSSDLLYLFVDEEGEVALNLNDNYYGELQYRIDFANRRGESFNWLFVDATTLSDVAASCGFEMEILDEDDHYQYLAKLTLKAESSVEVEQKA